jgi:hypothetical protein
MADEGVLTASSVDVPGLNVEGETCEEAIAEARLWAPELLRANGSIAETKISSSCSPAPTSRSPANNASCQAYRSKSSMLFCVRTAVV